MAFPDRFVFGAASSSYQIEGAVGEDGRGPSIWDAWCHDRTTAGGPGHNPTATRERVWSNHNADRACDHHRLYREDVAMMKRMGLQAYRFSVAWPRVLPDGTGRVEPRGLDFYKRLVDELLGAGITPYVTLFHWDYPLELFHRGGWMNRDSVEWFGEYASVIAAALGDRVKHWMTLNEPHVFLQFGHGDAKDAPGLRLGLRSLLLACHHALMSHGRGVQALRAGCAGPVEIGYAPVCVTRYPASASEADDRAATRAMAGFEGLNLWNNAWYNDAIFFGRYPEEGLALFGAEAPTPRAGDMELISQKLDFIGLNIYEGAPVRAGADGNPVACERHASHPLTAYRWPVEPKSLYYGPRFIHQRYGVPVYITENGMSGVDWVSSDGRVHDPQRIDFTRRYLLELERAVADGVDVRGYFHWSILDNFEWTQGFKERFGLVHVDFATQKRTIKDSGSWYANVARTRGRSLRDDPFATGAYPTIT